MKVQKYLTSWPSASHNGFVPGSLHHHWTAMQYMLSVEVRQQRCCHKLARDNSSNPQLLCSAKLPSVPEYWLTSAEVFLTCDNSNDFATRNRYFKTENRGFPIFSDFKITVQAIEHYLKLPTYFWKQCLLQFHIYQENTVLFRRFHFIWALEKPKIQENWKAYYIITNIILNQYFPPYKMQNNRLKTCGSCLVWQPSRKGEATTLCGRQVTFGAPASQISHVCL